MPDNARMTIASRCHQHPVHHLPAIILDRIPRERRHSTIRFLHDQIGRGKIPIAALAACKSGIQAAVRNPAQPQRQRTRTSHPVEQTVRALMGYGAGLMGLVAVGLGVVGVAAVWLGPNLFDPPRRAEPAPVPPAR